MPIVRRFFTGNTAANKRYVGPAGRLSFDIEQGAIRIHDGRTPGGHELAEIRDIEAALEEIAYTQILSGNVDGQEVTRKVGDNFGWRNLTGRLNLRGKGKADPSWEPFRDGTCAYLFSGSRLTECWFTFQLDHDYAVGTPLYPHVQWAPATQGSGTVRWGFEYTLAAGHGRTVGSVFPPSRTVTATHTVSEPAYTHLITEVDDHFAIPADFLEPDTIVQVRVFRDAGHPDDSYSGDVFMFTSGLHYQLARAATRQRGPNFYT